MTKRNEELKSIIVQGVITSTSDKGNERFHTSTPQKTAYIETDLTNTKLLEDFGLRKYTSKETGVNFFIVKLSQNVSHYVNKQLVDTISGLAGEGNHNFTTGERLVGLEIIKGTSDFGNDFYRLTAINGEIQEVERRTPEW